MWQLRTSNISILQVREEYDLILALSITKWIHLNWGDAGMKRFLKRTFLNLNPGGRLILEPQPFNKYYKRAKMTVCSLPDLFTFHFLFRMICLKHIRPSNSSRNNSKIFCYPRKLGSWNIRRWVCHKRKQKVLSLPQSQGECLPHNPLRFWTANYGISKRP